jgi:cephalosporin-C deacetylase-like acetyl esterase
MNIETMKTHLLLLLWAFWLPLSVAAQSLPGTLSLSPNADFSAAMVAGIDKMALRLIEQSGTSRNPTREKLRAALGMVDERLPVQVLEFLGDTSSPALLYETEQCRVLRVRWPVFEGVHGEGLLIQPKDKPHARVVLLPDADAAPENLVDPRWLASGCEVVIPALVTRGSQFSKSDHLGIRTNVPHREWIYRQSFLLGRHPIGYEVQKALAVVDWFKTQREQVPVIMAGVGEGGMLALYAGALDERIDGVFSAGHFAPREGMWREPLDRNVFGLLRDFGDAEIAGLIAPRPLVLQYARYPEYTVSMTGGKGERAIAAPGRLAPPGRSAFDAEVARSRTLAPQGRLLALGADDSIEKAVRQLLPANAADLVAASLNRMDRNSAVPVPVPAVDGKREERAVRELGRFTQRLIVACEAERQARFWNKLPLKPLAAFEEHTARERERFWNEVIGRLPDPDVPLNAKSRLVRETAGVGIYEVTLDVWEDVFAWGWLCLPKDLKQGERRPVVVCQHGLEGLPEDTVTEDQSLRAWEAYKAFALRLAEEGFITFAPHNPYRGKDAFRTLQRKLNPLGLTLFSVINGQHQRILEWLKAQPFTQPDKIAFYGLSYGGKSAMRIPAVLTDYCLSICSGDFDEWVRYCVSTELPISGYMHANEYEIWEWNLARHFNYGEMSALIAPRPFMVERGHDDGCGTDAMVNYEYAKVRRLYAKLGLSGRTLIEHFDGPHTIHGVGTFEFLRRELRPPVPKR